MGNVSKGAGWATERERTSPTGKATNLEIKAARELWVCQTKPSTLQISRVSVAAQIAGVLEAT